TILFQYNANYNMLNFYFLFIFFFQAEDGIRDLYVTGVQTCALPISTGQRCTGADLRGRCGNQQPRRSAPVHLWPVGDAGWRGCRSEERRVGKEWRIRGWATQ